MCGCACYRYIWEETPGLVLAEECQLKCVKRGGGGCSGLEGKTFFFFFKREKNKRNSIILFCLTFSPSSTFFSVYVGGKKEEGGGRLFLEHIPDSPFYSSHGRPFRFVVRLFEEKRRRRKASFIFQGLEGNLKR